MQATSQAEVREPNVARWWALGLSLAVHGLAILAFGLLTLPPAVELAPGSIVVELIGPTQFEAAAAAADAVDEPLPAVPAAPEVPPPQLPAMTTATQFFAAQVLDDPANTELRVALATTERSERIVQLCNLEGLEQLRLAWPGATADEIVPYAFGNPTIRGVTMDAPDGAFRSDEKWYAIEMICSVGPDYESVTDFRFRIGEPIPESEWATHYLTATDDDE